MSQQLAFPEVPAAPKTHDYTPQLRFMIARIGDGIWRSIPQIEIDLDFRFSQTGCGSRLRDLKKPFEGFISERKYEDGKNFYRVRRA